MTWIVLSAVLIIWFIFEIWGNRKKDRILEKDNEQITGILSNWDAYLLRRKGWIEHGTSRTKNES